MENPARFQPAPVLSFRVILSGVNSSSRNDHLPGGKMCMTTPPARSLSQAHVWWIVPSNVRYGQSRLFVVWQRIVSHDTPDIGAEPGTDSAGYGFKDQVDSHWLRFLAVLMMSAISAGILFWIASTGQRQFLCAPSIRRRAEPGCWSAIWPGRSQAAREEFGHCAHSQDTTRVSILDSFNQGFRVPRAVSGFRVSASSSS